MRFGSRGPSKFAIERLDRDCVRRRSTGTRHANVYRSVKEKQGNVVYRQRVLQTVTYLRVVSLVFLGHDLLKILIPSKKPHFRYGKNQFPERVHAGGNGA